MAFLPAPPDPMSGVMRAFVIVRCIAALIWPGGRAGDKPMQTIDAGARVAQVSILTLAPEHSHYYDHIYLPKRMITRGVPIG